MISRLNEDTIVAPATAAGQGGIGILRLSGQRAEELLLTVFRPRSASRRLRSHQLYYGSVVSAHGETIDEVLAVVMRAPRSYTREHVAEIHCHGGQLLMQRILDLLLQEGARLARPGEFTLRAFLNGRLDLTQAEGVIELIRARSQSAGRVALQQLQGTLSKEIHRFREGLSDLLALIEAHIDFPDEDIDLSSMAALKSRAAESLSGMETLLATFDSGRILREGIGILILGRPNVGKSSLLNALLGEERAIVTSIPGTTRDLIEEQLLLGGLPVRLIDTAGIRVSDDPVEVEGVARARRKVAQADLVLLVITANEPLHPEDVQAYEACADTPVLLVVNKADLGFCAPPEPLAHLPYLAVSALSGEGIGSLSEAIVRRFIADGSETGESFLLSDRRHLEALIRSRDALRRFLCDIDQGISHEFLAMELREALDWLDEITGETTPDAILDRIFSRFCIGK